MEAPRPVSPQTLGQVHDILRALRVPVDGDGGVAIIKMRTRVDDRTARDLFLRIVALGRAVEQMPTGLSREAVFSAAAVLPVEMTIEDGYACPRFDTEAFRVLVARDQSEGASSLRPDHENTSI
jgi:hypothetical protein